MLVVKIKLKVKELQKCLLIPNCYSTM